MKNVIRFLDNHLEEVICVFLSVLYLTLALVQIIARYTTLTLPWTEEAARYTFIWSCFIGVPWATRKLAHLKVDILILKLSPKMHRIYMIASHALVLVASAFITYFGWEVCMKQMTIGQMMTGLPLPMWIMYLILPVSFALNIIRCVEIIVEEIKAPALEGGTESC